MGSEYITFEQFKKVHLKVGVITEITDHPNADKLYVLKVDLGDNQTRIIVAGIKQFYPEKSELLGKQVIIVTNLQPRDIRGIKSEGMLLAASSASSGDLETMMSIVTLDKKLPAGAIVS